MNFQTKAMHLNIEGLNAKFDELKFLLAQLSEKNIKLDCILVCETVINCHNEQLFNLPGYKFICRNRTNKTKGGVGIYILDTIPYKVRDDLCVFVEGEFESIFIEICEDKCSTIVGEIYRVPDTNVQLSLERYGSIIDKLKPNNKRILIGTDQNFDYLKIDIVKATSDLLDRWIADSIIPTITKPTRVTHQSATLIDNIYVRDSNMNVHSGIICSNISDHFPVFCFVGKKRLPGKQTEPFKFTYRPMTAESVNQISRHIRDTDWTYLINLDTTDAFTEFSAYLNDVIHQFIPEKSVNIQPKHIIREKWMTKGLMKSSRTMNKLYRKCSGKKKTDQCSIKYAEYRNCYNKLKKNAKTAHYSQLFSQFKNDSKETWKLLRTILCKTNDKTVVSTTFKYNGKQITDPNSIANHFCDYFTDIGPQYANKIPSSLHSYPHYLAMKQTANSKSIFLSPTDQNEIMDILKSLKPKKSCGHDNISTDFLKKIGADISVPISILVNKSLSDGIVPDSEKLAKVVPIYKAKEKSDFSNYRPISLLTSLSKVLEKVVHKRTYHFLQQNDIFYRSQYGFRNSRSTIDAITKFVNDSITSLEAKESTISVFLDLSKAFDTIDHTILIKKLEFYGIRGQPLNWFRSYLSDRKQFVHYQNSNSGQQNMSCGVPQGSVLGPLLFIIYTNDLPACLDNTKSILFADDTTIYMSNKNIDHLYQLVNADLNRLNDWFKANKLSLNVGKTNFMLISNLRNVKNNKHVLKIGDSVIERKQCVKFLGVYIDEHLAWHEHIQACKSKLISALYAICRVKYIVPTESLDALYYSLAYPHLSYGIALWGATYATHMNKLVVLQKKILRALTHAGYNEHTHPLFVKTGILKLNDIYTLEVAKFMHKYINNSLPEALSDTFIHTNSIHEHFTRQHHSLRPPKYRLSISYRSILCKGPIVWNSIPSPLQNEHRKVVFIKTLKKKILREYAL